MSGADDALLEAEVARIMTDVRRDVEEVRRQFFADLAVGRIPPVQNRHADIGDIEAAQRAVAGRLADRRRRAVYAHGFVATVQPSLDAQRTKPN